MKKRKPWEPKRGKHPWRDFLTRSEGVLIEQLDAEIARLKRRLAELSAQRNPIVNRAIHRAKYQPAKD